MGLVMVPTSSAEGFEGGGKYYDGDGHGVGGASLSDVQSIIS